jgi:hypothetical protein
VCESCIIELPNNLFGNETFSFTFNPWAHSNEDIFSITNIPYESIANKGKSFNGGFPYDWTVLGWILDMSYLVYCWIMGEAFFFYNAVLETCVWDDPTYIFGRRGLGEEVAIF